MRRARKRRDTGADRVVDTRETVPDRIAHIVQPSQARGKLVVGRERLPGGMGYVSGPDDDGTRVRRGDVFDRLEEYAHRHRLQFFLTPGQVQAGRRYGHLHERYSVGLSARSTLSSVLPQAGGGGGLSAMDCHLLTAQSYDRAVRAIGGRVALAVRRVRPSDRGGADRRGITDRALVDAVVLEACSLEQVLRAHGWAVDGKARGALQSALADALERLRNVL